MPLATVHEYAPASTTKRNKTTYQPKWTYEPSPFSPPQPIIARMDPPEESIPYIVDIEVKDIITKGFKLIPNPENPQELTLPADLQHYCIQPNIAQTIAQIFKVKYMPQKTDEDEWYESVMRLMDKAPHSALIYMQDNQIYVGDINEEESQIITKDKPAIEQPEHFLLFTTCDTSKAYLYRNSQCYKVELGEAVHAIIGDAKKIDLRKIPPNDPLWIAIKAAEEKELKQMENYKVFQPTTKQEHINQIKKQAPFPTKFVYEYKVIDGKKAIKARLVAEGVKKFDFREGIDSTTGMPRPRALRLLCTYVTQRPKFTPRDVLALDVKNAFLQSPMIGSKPVLVQAPKRYPQLFGKDGIAILNQALYGTQEAGRCWELFFRDKVIIPLGFTQSLAQDSVYIRYINQNGKQVIDAVVYVHVDDVLIFSGASTADAIATEISKKVEFKDKPYIPTRFCGIDFEVSELGIFLGQPHLTKELHVPDATTKIDKPLPLNATERYHDTDSGSKPLNVTGHGQYRKVNGEYLFIQITRPDCLFSMSYNGRSCHAPTESDWRLLVQSCQYAKQTYEYGLYYPSREAIKRGHQPGFKYRGNDIPSNYYNQDGSAKTQQWEVYVDASFLLQCAQTGYIIMLNGCLIDMRSVRQKRQASSTTKAELNAIFEAIDSIYINQWLASELLLFTNNDLTTMWSDSLNLVQAFNNDHPKMNEAAMRMNVLQIRRLIDNLIFKESPTNPAMDQLPNTKARIEAAKQPTENKRSRDKEHSCLLFMTILDQLATHKFTKVAINHVDGINNKADALTKPLDVFNIYKDAILYHVSCVKPTNQN